MTIYLVVFSYLAVASVLELLHIKVSKPARQMAYFLIAVTLIAIAGFRYGLETDYWHYYYVFHGITNPSSLEPGFKLFKTIIREITSSYNIFCIIVAVISVGLKAKIFSKYRYAFIILFCYYLRFYVLFELNAIRQGIALTFVIISIFNLVKDDKKKYILYLLIAIMFHASSVFGFIALFIKNTEFKFKHIMLAYIICLGFRLFLFEAAFRSLAVFIPYVLSSQNNLIHGVQYIINAWDKLPDLYYLSLSRVIASAICLFFISNGKENKLYFNLYFVGSLLNIVFWGLNTISFRVPALFYIFEGFILNDALLRNRLFGRKKHDLIFTICFLGIAFCDIWTFITYLNDSTTLVPYQTFLEK